MTKFNERFSYEERNTVKKEVSAIAIGFLVFCALVIIGSLISHYVSPMFVF